MASSAFLKYGSVGVATYTLVNVTTFTSIFTLLATGLLEPVPLLRTAAKGTDYVGIETKEHIDSLEAKWNDSDQFRIGTTALVSLALTKLLLPVKISMAACLMPLTTRLYARYLASRSR